MRAAWAAAALVIALALVESALGLMGSRRFATAADWQAAAAYVRGKMTAGDLVVFAPGWIDPVGRRHLGDKMPIEMVARADAERYARIWELSVRGARAEEAGALAPAEVATFGRLTVRRYDQPAAKLVHDLTARFSDARVSMGPRGGDTQQVCAVDGDGRRCGMVRVEPRVLEIDYRPRRGLLVPVTGGDAITLDYDEVPGGTLVGYVGLHDYYARKSADGVVMFRVRVDDSQSVLIPVRNPTREGEGWQRFQLELAPGTHRVRFELSAERPAHRLPGFHAEVRAP